jgi:hypothetical protein
MTTTSKVAVTEGSGKNLATYSFTEDAVTKETSRVALTDTVGADIFGSTADAKNAATDTTSVKAISIWKQISASVQAIATSIAGTLTVATHAVTQSGSWVLAANQSVNNAQINGVTPLMGNGATGTGSQRVTIASDNTPFPVNNSVLTAFGTGKYITVAASTGPTTLQTSTGATGDYISGVLVIPATTSPGAITLTDNSTAITIFAGGASSVSNLVPFFIPLGALSASGAWKLTAGANVSCIGIGKFS